MVAAKIRWLGAIGKTANGGQCGGCLRRLWTVARSVAPDRRPCVRGARGKAARVLVKNVKAEKRWAGLETRAQGAMQVFLKLRPRQWTRGSLPAATGRRSRPGISDMAGRYGGASVGVTLRRLETRRRGGLPRGRPTC